MQYNSKYANNLYYNKLDAPIMSHYYYFGMFLIMLGQFMQVIVVIFCIFIIMRLLY